MKKQKKPVIIFLCTPRCGTQWLAKNLGECYSHQVIALHEPIKYEYYPRLNLGRHELPSRPTSNTDLNEHLDYIEEVTRGKTYIEVGWQSIAGIAELNNRFSEQLRLVHLYRNPLRVAASLVTHNWYAGKDRERNEKAEISPFDDVALLDEYGDRWDNLKLFEKALYYWTEINLAALGVQQQLIQTPFYSLKFEDLFKKSKANSRIYLLEVLSFMGLPFEKKLLDAIKIPHDEHRYKTHHEVDWKKIEKHPQTKALAMKLGYDLNDTVDLNRYQPKPIHRKIISRLKSKF